MNSNKAPILLRRISAFYLAIKVAELMVTYVIIKVLKTGVINLFVLRYN